MTDKELNTAELLEEFSIMELEQRLEFEAWCDGNCSCQPSDGGGTGGGGGGGGTDPGGGGGITPIDIGPAN
jgi:uncharacterized membrane protein